MEEKDKVPEDSADTIAKKALIDECNKFLEEKLEKAKIGYTLMTAFATEEMIPTCVNINCTGRQLMYMMKSLDSHKDVRDIKKRMMVESILGMLDAGSKTEAKESADAADTKPEAETEKSAA